MQLRVKGISIRRAVDDDALMIVGDFGDVNCMRQLTSSESGGIGDR